MKKQPKSRIVLWVIVAVLIPVMVYLMIDVGSAQEIFTRYNSLKADTASSIQKSLVFLSSYIQSTGDISLGHALGLSDEDIEEMVAGTAADSTVSQAGAVEWGDDLQAAIDQYVASHISNMKLKTSCGVDYPADIQAGPMTANGSGVGLDSGCMFFSCAVCASMVRHQVIGVDTLIQNAGHNTSTDPSNGNLIIDPPLKKVGMYSSYQYENGQPCTPAGLLHELCNVGTDHGSSVTYDSSFIANGGVYLVHVSGDAANKYSTGSPPNGGQHWFVVAGMNSDGSYIVLNGSGSNGSAGEFYAEDSNLVNHWIEVSNL